MNFTILTIFPDHITNYTDTSILGRAQAAGHICVRAINIRDFATDKHKQVDDTPYGGGAGMVMKPEPIYRALESVDALPEKIRNSKPKIRKKTVLLSPRGKQFDQRLAEEWAKDLNEIIFVCGRYEGVDQRVVDHMVDEEISIGPYVLAGGELGALVITEAVARQVPGVLGNADSLLEETFGAGEREKKREDGELLPVVDVDKEYPQYTKPAEFNGWEVPEILLSGDHKKIGEWRQSQATQ